MSQNEPAVETEGEPEELQPDMEMATIGTMTSYVCVCPRCCRCILIHYNFAEGVSATVTVLVGKEKTAFILHKQLLCDKVPYFKARLKADW